MMRTREQKDNNSHLSTSHETGIILLCILFGDAADKLRSQQQQQQQQQQPREISLEQSEHPPAKPRYYVRHHQQHDWQGVQADQEPQQNQERARRRGVFHQRSSQGPPDFEGFTQTY